MRAYVLADIGDRLAVEVLLRCEDAWAALDEIREEQPQWAMNLYVVPIELDEWSMSMN